MNDSNPNLPMVPTGEGDRKPQPRPGEDLTPQQRQVAEALVTDGLTWASAAKTCEVPASTVYYWRDHTPGFVRYVNHLTNAVLSESERIVKIRLAARAPAAADRLAQLATSKRAKPAHPYQVDAASRLLDRTGGKPAPASVDVGVKVPTEQGDIVIVFHSNARPGSQQEPEGETP